MQGKYAAMAVCWLLGNGCLVSWNSMLTIEDYYGYLFPVLKSLNSLAIVLLFLKFFNGTALIEFHSV